MNKIIHFAYYEQPTESNPDGYEGDPICGTQAMDPEATNHIVLVTCKKCLKKMRIEPDVQGSDTTKSH